MNPIGERAASKSLPLGTRLTLSYLAIILVGIGVASPLAWLTIERLYLENQRANLLAQAKLIAGALSADTLRSTDPTPYPYSQLSNVQPGIHTRVIDPQGAVVISLAGPEQPASPDGLSLPQLAQNSAGTVTPKELMSRPEIDQARRGQPATALRRVDVAGGQPVLYAAAPVFSSDGNVVQIVYLATPLPDTQWAALPIIVRWQFIGVILGAILIASMAGLLLARRISRPLGKLADAALAVAGGDLGQTVPEDPAITELSLLGRAFNSMTNSLRKAEQVKDAFIVDVTHELRTPLTVIKGTIETLQDGALDDLAAREPFLNSMSQETERLIRLVNDLLVLTRADSDALNLQLRPVDLTELARSRCEHMQPYASQRQVQLIPTPSSQMVEQNSNQNSCLVLADADRLAQVIDNLLDNAIRYSPAGGEIKIVVEKDIDQVKCQVVDTGPGIPAKHLPNIFERFYRVEPARERNRGGSGLGLSIVRGLVMAHGGLVSASSVEGQGTTVTFRLPALDH